MKQELLNKRKNWYSKIYVQFELLKAMRNKEVVFMDRKENWKCIRGMFIRNIPTLERYFNEFKFFEKDYNIYISCSHFENIPYFTTDLKERSKETSIWFNNQAKKEIYAHDLLIDFDTDKEKNFNNMKAELVKAIQIFNQYKICFWIYPSGNNFQIVIDNSCFIGYNSKKFMKLAKVLKERFELNFLDLKGIGVFNKIRKCEYSLVVDKVILPIYTKKFQDNIGFFFDTLKYDSFDCNKILSNYQIKNREILKFNEYGKEQNKKHFDIFMQINFIKV